MVLPLIRKVVRGLLWLRDADRNDEYILAKKMAHLLRVSLK